MHLCCLGCRLLARQWSGGWLKLSVFSGAFHSFPLSLFKSQYFFSHFPLPLLISLTAYLLVWLLCLHHISDSKRQRYLLFFPSLPLHRSVPSVGWAGARPSETIVQQRVRFRFLTCFLPTDDKVKIKKNTVTSQTIGLFLFMFIKLPIK